MAGMTCFLRRVSVSLTQRRVRESYVVILSGCIKVSLRFVLIFILTRQFFFAFVLLSMLFPRWIKGAPLIHIRLLNDFLCKKSQNKILEIFAMPNKKINHHSLYLRERKKILFSNHPTDHAGTDAVSSASHPTQPHSPKAADRLTVTESRVSLAGPSEYSAS